MVIETKTRSYTVVRDGLEDMSFTGQLLASGTDHENEGPQKGCWSEISIHKTNGGEYVVGQCFVTQPLNEEESHQGDMCGSAQDVYDLLAKQGEDGDTGPSRLAMEALEEAAKVDSAFEGIIPEK